MSDSTITDALRAQVLEELPELAQIGDADLKAKAIEAWALALTRSSFTSSAISRARYPA